MEFPKVSSKREVVANINLNDDAVGSLRCLSVVDQSETTDCDVVFDVNESHVLVDGCILPNSTRLISDTVEEQSSNVTFDGVLNNEEDRELSLGNAVLGDHTKVGSTSIGSVKGHSPREEMTGLDFSHSKQEEVEPPMESEGSSTSLEDTEVQKIDIDSDTGLPLVVESSFLHMGADCNQNDPVVGCIHESGEWMVYWDSFYMRNYFFNTKTHESTWNPPPGLEHFALSDAHCTANESIAEVSEMDVLEDAKSEHICSVLGGTRSHVNLLGDNAHCQPPDALLEGSSILVESSETSASSILVESSETSVSVTTLTNSHKHNDESREWQTISRNTMEDVGCRFLTSYL